MYRCYFKILNAFNISVSMKNVLKESILKYPRRIYYYIYTHTYMCYIHFRNVQHESWVYWGINIILQVEPFPKALKIAILFKLQFLEK